MATARSTTPMELYASASWEIDDLAEDLSLGKFRISTQSKTTASNLVLYT